MVRRLPPGFRFHPTDVELIKYYLKRKVTGKRFPAEAIAAIPEVDIYKFAPWELREQSCLTSKDLKWYFFCPRGKKYSKGGRMNRTTGFGFWKTTGRDRPVVHGGKKVGMIRSLIFHRREPQVQRTDWVMHEYRLDDNDLSGVAQDAFVICMIFEKKGPGPNNGAQYGAPFEEEEWDHDEDVIDPSHGVPMDGVSGPAFLLPQNQSSTFAVGPGAAGTFFNGSTSNLDPPLVVQPASDGILCISGNISGGDFSGHGAVDPFKDGISCSNIPDSTAQVQSQIVADSNHRREDDIFEGLGDLEGLATLNGLGSGNEVPGQPKQNTVSQFNSNEFLEMIDLEPPLGESFLEMDDLDPPLPPCNEACQYDGASSSTVSTFDCYNTSSSISFASVPCGDGQLATGLPVNPTGQSFPNLSHQPQLDRNGSAFFEENGANNCANYGYIGEHNTYSTPTYSGNNLGVERGLSRDFKVPIVGVRMPYLDGGYSMLGDGGSYDT